MQNNDLTNNKCANSQHNHGGLDTFIRWPQVLWRILCSVMKNDFKQALLLIVLHTVMAIICQIHVYSKCIQVS